MGTNNSSKNPGVFHPEHGGHQQEVNRLLEEETGKVIRCLGSKIPEELFKRLSKTDELKEKLYDCLNRNYQKISEYYIETTTGETAPENVYIEGETAGVPVRYSPKKIAELLDTIDGADKFNTGEIEKSVAAMYGRMQKYIEQGIHELEAHTNGLLRQKTDTGIFIRDGNACSIVKCVFKDNVLKPKTVTDLKLSINISDSGLIDSVFRSRAAAEYLIGDLIFGHVIDTINREIDGLNDREIETLSTERITEFLPEIDPACFETLNVRENIKKIIDTENIRSREFATVVNSLTSILDTLKMGYQYIENFRNGGEILIREYEDTDTANLPDERYQIRLRCFDDTRLAEERQAYDIRIKTFQTEAQHLWELLEVIYQDSKSIFRVNDFEDLSKKNKSRIKALIKDKASAPPYEDTAKTWDEFSFIRPAGTGQEQSGRTYLYEKERIRVRLVRIRERIKNMYDCLYPVERRVMEDRLCWLEEEYSHFDRTVNPYHLEPGILIDIDITSIKRKRTTLDSMAKALDEFLEAISPVKALPRRL